MIAKMGQVVSPVFGANTIFALVFPGIVSAFGVFFLRQTYMGIPKEIGEAAYLDGCNQWQTFYKVMFPLTGTSVAALTIFTAVWSCTSSSRSSLSRALPPPAASDRPVSLLPPPLFRNSPGAWASGLFP